MSEASVVDESVPSPQAAGGHARSENMTPEERKSVASRAAKARWAKKKSAPTPEPPPPPPVEVAKPVKRKARPMPKAFKGASSYAEKRLAEAIKERAEAMGKVAALNAEIPSLVQIIRALGSSNVPIPQMTMPVDMGMQTMPVMPIQMPGSEIANLRMPQLPHMPMAQGGAISGADFANDPPEDAFLGGNSLPGGSWV